MVSKRDKVSLQPGLYVIILSFFIIFLFSFCRFEMRTREAAQLKFDLDRAQDTIKSAESLVGKLEGEYIRWSSQVNG